VNIKERSAYRSLGVESQGFGNDSEDWCLGEVNFWILVMEKLDYQAMNQIKGKIQFLWLDSVFRRSHGRGYEWSCSKLI
jgi:hypothetical protein